MPQDKTLPDDDTDDSMPGRYEEANIDYYEANPDFFIKSKPSSYKAIVMAAIILGTVFAGALSYYFANQDTIDSKIIQSGTINLDERLAQKYGTGEYGSDHAHAAITVFIDGQMLNFAQPSFQLSSKFIHFENHNSYLIHKHATGATLQMLFESFGSNITSDCMTLGSNQFCGAIFYVNGVQQYDISSYEISHNDRILISFGDEKLIGEQLQFLNSLEIFGIPEDRTIPGDNILI